MQGVLNPISQPGAGTPAPGGRAPGASEPAGAALRLVDEGGEAGEAQTAAELASLLDRAGRGENDAWRELMDRYARRVFAMARSRCPNDELAEEITQSVFVTVATSLSSGAYAERGRFESWLFRITMNRVRDEHRRVSRRGEVGGEAALLGTPDTRVPGPDHRALHDDSQEVTRLREALAGLSEADREVIELRHHAGLSFKTMAEALGQPLGTLLARHHRALRKIKDVMEGAEPKPARSSKRASQ